MTIENVADRVALTVAAEQASHGERFVMQSQDGTVYFRTPGRLAIDKLTADECALRWNAHKDLMEALTQAVEQAGPFGDDTRPEWFNAACTAIAKARGER